MGSEQKGRSNGKGCDGGPADYGAHNPIGRNERCGSDYTADAWLGHDY